MRMASCNTKTSFTCQMSSPTIQPQFLWFSRSFSPSCHLWSLRWNATTTGQTAPHPSTEIKPSFPWLPIKKVSLVIQLSGIILKQVTGRVPVVELAGQQREWRTKPQLKQAKSKSKMLSTSTTGLLKKMSCDCKERVFSVLLRLPFLSAKPAAPSS